MYTWIAETFGVGDGIARVMSFIIALAIVFGLIGLVLFVLRRLTGNRISTGRNRQPRIAVMDAMHIDPRRRLLLVRRDNVEHLILVGGPTDVVVEQAIVRGAPVAAPYPRAGQGPGQPAPQYGTAPYEGEPEPYAAAPATAPASWPVAPAAATAATPVAPVAMAAHAAAQPVAAAPEAAVRAQAQVAPTPAAPRASSLRQTAQEAALAALRSRNTTPRVEAATPDGEDETNVKSLRPRIAALTEPLRRPPVADTQVASAVHSEAANPDAARVQPTLSQQPARPAEAIAAAASTLTTKAGASVAAAGAAVADLARSLSRSSERTGTAPEPEVKRQLTPPSSGPAARARTAFPNPLAAQQAAAAPQAVAEIERQPAPAATEQAGSTPPAKVDDPESRAAAAAPTVADTKMFGGFPVPPRKQPEPATPPVAAEVAPFETPPAKREPVMANVRLGGPVPGTSTRPLAPVSSEVRLTPPVLQTSSGPVKEQAQPEAKAPLEAAPAADDIFELESRPEPKQASTETVAAAATLASLTIGSETAVNPVSVSHPPVAGVIPEIKLTAADLVVPTQAATAPDSPPEATIPAVTPVSEAVVEAPAIEVPAIEVPKVEVQAGNRDAAGVNAIEEEMARLLSEIGVQGRK
ncbi:flagellar biosynthetic protein FliO [Pannonibacter carbonis]|uniref:flagellar biosynthetic protein FliO n=1 Tax=Pannonibacter carbonis TaxID=2067569 RepID=UPI000D10CE7A|nr:flagellar biosynthetic protein FliO [Pannonibacter carbonis]